MMFLRSCLLALVGVVSLVFGGDAYAQASSARIQDPLPSELRDRMAKLVRSMRPADADAALAHTKIIDGAGWREHNILFIRIEADCRDDLCMTVIARVDDKAIIPQLILLAKSRIIFFDSWGTLWGKASLPIAIEGRGGSAIALHDRDGTWVAEACADCFPDLGEIPKGSGSSSTPPTPKATLPVETFEDFRRAMGRLP